MYIQHADVPPWRGIGIQQVISEFSIGTGSRFKNGSTAAVDCDLHTRYAVPVLVDHSPHQYTRLSADWVHPDELASVGKVLRGGLWLRLRQGLHTWLPGDFLR